MNEQNIYPNLPVFIVRYLPQFHRIKENDEWWGEGFTEWTAVRKAESLFPGHEQPQVPYQNNYYDLSMKKTMQWQAELGKKYGIGCFSFYHYWFDKSRKILEKPAENLLKWQDIEIPFCFTWANETWARTWSKLRGVNTWGNRYETNSGGHSDGILLEQKYGEREAWIKHFRYLLPFFKDRRYLKKNGRPVFIIYKPEHLHCWPDMRACWEEEARRAGLEGLYIIGEAATHGVILGRDYDARMLREPNCSWQSLQVERLSCGVRIYNHEKYWQEVLSRHWEEGQAGMPTYVCLADSFDNTPRNGSAGAVMQGSNPAELREHIKEALAISSALGHDYIFYNAWNEWGEGMYLEPDVKYGYGRLEAVRDALNGCKELKKKVDIHSHEDNGRQKIERSRDKYAAMCRAFDRWLFNREHGKRIADYLQKQGWHRIGIYGMGYLGRHLLTELSESTVKVDYIIDRNIYARDIDYPTYQISSDLPPVDVIIVTIAGEYEEIRRKILEQVNYRVVSLEHILFEL